MFDIELNGEFVTFFILAVVMIAGAVLMVSFTKVVHMVLSMAAVFLGAAGMYVLLEAEFLAFVQVLIYAGAVSILMIFGIMMTNHRDASAELVKPLKDTLAAVSAIALFGLLFYAIRDAEFEGRSGGAPSQGTDNTLAIGEALFHNHVLPFELVSVLLTVAFIGAIALAKKEA
ncbi:NADH-quinone oxidoreductase subunit J [Paenibacillus xylaniclasticus]|uniref:NADH-quinone oxidoreductase subunit J n=1 Tax=Paenibacillus xylaniclasticus TaxID=588083 RepID=UPI000FD9147C|nr:MULTISPECIES: NADH-quinone oxidoreductase subunit J [Paenibacillus]GFN32696.1 NADH:ubiquinone oxidoreductase subunit J [Paenibacillus curdlanolyticus]